MPPAQTIQKSLCTAGFCAPPRPAVTTAESGLTACRGIGDSAVRGPGALDYRIPDYGPPGLRTPDPGPRAADGGSRVDFTIV